MAVWVGGFVSAALAQNSALAPLARQQPLDNSGRIQGGACLYSYAAGTTNPEYTYNASDLAVGHRNTNPIVLDAYGRAPAIYLTATAYKFVLGQKALGTCPASPGTVIWTQDNVFDVGQLLKRDLADTTYGGSLVAFKQAGAGAVARTVQQRLADTISVKDFAAGNGSDESAALQKALTAANGVKVLHFPSGTYAFSTTLVPPSGTRIECDPGAELRWTGGATAAILATDVYKFRFAGCSLINAGTGTIGIDIPYHTGGFSVYGYTIEDNLFTGFTTAQIRVDRLFDSWIIHNYFDMDAIAGSVGYMDIAVGGVNMTFLNNYFYDMGAGGKGVVMPGEASFIANGFGFDTADDNTIGVKGCINCAFVSNHFEGTAANQHGTAIYLGGVGFEWKNVSILDAWGFYLNKGIVVDTPDSLTRQNSVSISGTEWGTVNTMLEVTYAANYVPRVNVFDNFISTSYTDPNSHVVFPSFQLKGINTPPGVFEIDNATSHSKFSIPSSAGAAASLDVVSGTGQAQITAKGGGASGYVWGGSAAALIAGVGCNADANVACRFDQNGQMAGFVWPNKRWSIDSDDSSPGAPVAAVGMMHVRSDPTDKPVTIIAQAAASQANDVLQGQDSAGGVLGGLDINGALYGSSKAYAAISALGAVANGKFLYCSDCQVTGAGDNTCKAGGAGAFAFRVDGAWRCFALQN